jgi:YVTN family beta-propeller protein
VAPDALPKGALVQRHIQNGIAIDFALAPVKPSARSGGTFVAGEDVTFRFTLADAATNTPLTNARPAAWLARRPKEGPRDPAALARTAAAFARGSPSLRPDLDLNSFYVLVLNGDATITALDPLQGFGGSRLLALVQLAGVGEDWVLSADQTRLFVSVPSAGHVAVIDTRTWAVSGTVSVAGATRLVLQPDGHYLWVAGDSGVTVIATDDLTVCKRITTGEGRHEIVFDPDNRFAFVTNGQDGTVSILDIRRLEKVKDVPTGAGPSAIAYSAAAQLVYVADAVDGSIAAIDARSLTITARVPAGRGISDVKFAAGGRLGIVVRPGANRVDVLDSATNRIVQTVGTDKGPDQVVLSDQFAYVRHRDSATVLLLPLDRIGTAGEKVPVFEVPGGQCPLGRFTRASRAATITQASGKGAALLANPGDRSVYYYEEGMAAPRGSFTNYGREARGVLTIERNLRPRHVGAYETTARLPRAGEYEVIFLLEAPRVLHAFALSIGAAPQPVVRQGQLSVQPLLHTGTVKTGVPARVPFRLLAGEKGTPRAGLRDVCVLAHSPGRWQRRFQAEETTPGVYTLVFTPPRPGLYYLHFESRSSALLLNNPWYVVLEAKEEP